MKKLMIGLSMLVFIVGLASLASAHAAQARGRYGSFRVGGYTSHGKGSHYIGGYVRSCRGLACR